MGNAGNWVSAEYYDRFKRGGKRLARNFSNDRTAALERMHMKTFTEMAMNRFEWFGLPESVDVRFLEHTLFYNALSVFFVHDTIGPLALRGVGVGPLNMHDNFTRYRVYGNRYVGRTLNSEQSYQPDPDGTDAMVTLPAECVPIWANYLRTPDLDYAMIYASKLADIDRTIEINAKNSRFTKIVTSSESQKLSMENINRQSEEGSSTIFVDEIYDPENIGAFDIGIPADVHLNIPILRTRIHSDAMSLFGINNANQDKKERLVADEVAANDDQVKVMRAINLNARQEACKAIKKVFGLDIWVEYRTENAPLSPAEPEPEIEPEEEAE